MRLYCIVLLLVSSSLASRSGGGSHRPSHSYPHSTGYSGTSHGGGSYYPHSTGLSGNSNGYNTRNYNQQQYSSRGNYSPKSEVHHHYHYSPPQQITYGTTYHPVYHGTPPVYVYEYRDSGSRFDNLLTGLALYNLGRLSANRHDHNYDSRREYSGTPGEICKLGIRKLTGEYEETRIDCKLMSSFIWEANVTPGGLDVSLKTVSTTVTNTTSSANVTATNTSVTTVTVTDALTSKGPSIQVTSGMTCYMIRLSSYSTVKKNVECGLLQEYARTSMRRNGSESLKPVMAILLNLILCNTLSFVLYL
ncbi:unnamed protein product [Arctia plantaginis]|uniref:Uncharacterized protein n=1 Tax=Arctia plantaginis TaxID=874455 RepID=A0A8S1AGR4_ARCPL|nr:unnamed protein product [Arctia plantaginis]